MSPELAQMRSADRVRKCLLFGVDPTHRGHHESDAFDPKPTWRHGLQLAKFCREQAQKLPTTAVRGYCMAVQFI
jgi:hypothetical protein